mgnify:FL=1
MKYSSCGHLNVAHVEEPTRLRGWIDSVRDHGGVIFIDLRDETGITQVVVEPENKEFFSLAERCRSEFVLSVEGIIRRRPDGTTNEQLPTGEVELLVSSLEILSESDPLPFQLDDFSSAGEEVRLKYRFLDLRRSEMQKNIRARSKVSSSIREFMDKEGFLDIETPMMTKATPEGARDFLVPSRISRGSFYALPQSPQLFKQLLMASGFERYYQIVRCFRDEDTRADRQPEFTQLDIEKAFTDEDEIINLSEKLIKFVFKKLLDIKLPKFPKMTYSEAIERFGSDKPDLRINLELKEVKEIFLDSDFKVFSGPANDSNSRVVALKISSELTRSKIDSYTEFVGKFGAKGLAYIKVNNLKKGNDGLQSPILKFLSKKEIDSLFKSLGVTDGDTVFFGAGHKKIVSDSMGALRNKIAEDFDLIEESWKPVWITNWPLFEESIGGDLSPAHHPFTSFKGSIEDLESDPRAVEANAYDLVINGTEVGGGSIRIHKSSEQAKVLEVLGISKKEAQNKFGFFLDALNFGFPPHGGIAFGLDRLVMLMMGADSIRSVIPFPKTQSALCLLTDAPTRVDSEQLYELGISLTDPEGD